MKYLLFIIVLFSMQIILVSCPDGKFALDPGVGATISIKNNANYGLYVYAAIGDIPPVFPDTTLPSQKPDNKKTRLFGYVPPNISLWSVETKTAWGDLFKNISNDTLSIYIFNADTLSKYSWEEIRNGYKVLRRYDISIQDVEKRSYKIVYP